MESKSDQLWETIPQDILTQVFKYLPIAPDRWHCLFVNKAFYAAMQSRLLWTHITLQDCSVMPQKRGWDAMERTVNRPKKAEFISAAFLAYLKKNHRDVVVELDLTNVALESEGEYLPRKCNISYSPEYNEDHMNAFWSLMFDFPNLKNLSLFGAFFLNGSMVTFGSPANKNLRSSVRNLNLIKQNLFYHSKESFKTLLEFAPELEVLQVQDMSEEDIGLEKQYPKLKQLLFVLCNSSVRTVFEICPNLEVFVNHKYDHGWGEPEEPPKPPADKKNLVYIPGERKAVRDLSVDDITERISKAIVNVRYSNNTGLPHLHDLVRHDLYEHLEVCLKTLKLDPNIKFRAAPDVVLDPFVLMYPYDSQSDDRGWRDDGNDAVTLPPLLENGDTPLHYAVKRKSMALVRILLENGADPNSQNSAYRTPLCYAHSLGLIELLIEHGASLNFVDKDGWNLLMNFIANKGRLYPTSLVNQIEGHISFNSASEIANPEARLAMLDRLIELGCDINYQAPNGLNALKIALSVNDEPIVEYLLKHMKEPLVEKSPCIGLLSCIATNQSLNIETVAKLQALGTDPTIVVEASKLLINYQVVKLLSLGADPTILDERGQTYLHVAAERNQLHFLNSVEHITKDRTKLLTMTDSAGLTFLHYAVLPPKLEVIWECDIQSEYLTWLTKQIKQSVSNATEKANSLDSLLPLIASDGVLDVQASSGETPLLLACRSMTGELRQVVVKRLLDHGANPNIVDHDGGSPLIAAAYALDHGAVYDLIEAGADVAHCDKKGMNALLAATLAVSKRYMESRSHNYRNGLGRDQPKMTIKESEKQNYIKIFKLLLEKKIPVNQQEKMCGLSVLHLLAALSEDVSVEWITTLVKDYNADIDLRSLTNESPLHYAIRHKAVVQVKTLLELGADVNGRGFGMMTPLHYVLEMVYGIHGVNPMSDDVKLCVDGHKIIANTFVRYPSWMWSTPNDRSQNPQASVYEGENDNGWIMFMDLIRHAADKLDFNAKSFMGNLPLHGCWVLSRNVVDPNNITQGVADPKHFILSIPLTMLKYATRDQLLTKNMAESTPFDSMLNSSITTLKPSALAGTYPSVKEAFNIVLKRCLELVGDTIDINHVINSVVLDCEFSIVEILAKKAKENGTFTAAHVKKSQHSLLPSLLKMLIESPKLYALFKEISEPLWSTTLDREPLKQLDPAIFSFIFSYQGSCGYDDKATRPKMFDALLKNGGIDWTVQSKDTKENLLLAVYSWWRNAGCEALLYNQITNRTHIIEGDKIIADLIKVGVDPHQKNIFGQSFADMVPQYEKVVENVKYLTGEEKSAIQKETYFVDKKPSLLMELLQAITHN